MSGYNERSRYHLRSMGDGSVADNEPASQATPLGSGAVPGFVVGHHPGTVTVDVCRQLRRELTSDDAYRLGLTLLAAADLSRIPWTVA